MVGILQFIGAAFTPLLEAVKHFTIDATIKAELKAAIEKAQKEIELKTIELQGKVVDLETELIEQRGKAVEADTTGHWYQRLWRPLFMYLFWWIIFQNLVIKFWVEVFGYELPDIPLPTQAWPLITLGFSGYVVARTFEKKSKDIKAMIRGESQSEFEQVEEVEEGIMNEREDGEPTYSPKKKTITRRYKGGKRR